ncbi:MAG TPA: hypothetical protein VGN11_06160, partial [Candidatus Baltobacteraceae bacterium]|nr:hypothetical protein [Candidatus Baltobacteraceae bacterium]
PRAIEAFKRYGAGSTYSRPESAALLSHVYALLHRQSDARRELTYAKQHADDVDPEDLALALDATGDRKVALSLLRRKRDPMSMMAIENDPRFDTLRHDAQFRQITAPA